MGEAFLSLLWVILCVVGVLALAYLFTRYVAGQGGAGGACRGGGTEQFRALARLPLGKEESMVLVQAGERYLLLGVTQTEISKLAELTQEEARKLCTPQDPAQSAKFGQTLRAVLQQRKGR